MPRILILDDYKTADLIRWLRGEPLPPALVRDGIGILHIAHELTRRREAVVAQKPRDEEPPDAA